MKSIKHNLGRDAGWILFEGDVGVEIEAEGRNLPPRVKGWDVTGDGSLRDGIEYVLQEPCNIDNLRGHLERVREAYLKYDSEINDSVRTSIHVHVNVQDLDIIQVYNMMVLYLILEEILVEYCGEGRSGNLFCLRARDAEYVVTYLAKVAKHRAWGRLNTDDIRYSAMNAKAVIDRGSLEFRTMRGTTDMDTIDHWAKLLLSLRESAKLFNDPREIIRGFSEAEGPNFVRQILGDLGRPIIGRVADLGAKVKSGMRFAQDVAFAIDWTAYKMEEEAREKNNPFHLAEQPGVMGVQFDNPMAFDEAGEFAAHDGEGLVGRAQAEAAPRPDIG